MQMTIGMIMIIKDKTRFKQDEHGDDDVVDVHHVLVEEDIDGVGVVSVRTVVKCKLLDQKEDHCDHKLREGTIIFLGANIFFEGQYLF